MVRRILLPVILTCVLENAAAGGSLGSGGGARKVLPLDSVPNAVLKTRADSEYLPGRVILKVMPDVQVAPGMGATGVSSIDDLLARVSPTSVEPMFPAVVATRSRGDVDLTRFCVVRYTAPVDPFSLAEELSQLPAVQYAEPWFVYPVSFDPNDPSFPSQYGLSKIQAPAAWDISQGDTSVVIGIVDSGVQLGHPDLTGNIWHNPGELGTDGMGDDKRTNGIDDDGNGYVDDWQGWDFGGADYNTIVPDNDPNPTGTNNAHGTHVAGIASASTDNAVGIAGTGFKCRLLAIKTAADNDYRGPGGVGYIISGTQGIAYAATMGADVMNCSWGGGGGSQVEQDIINWATSQGTLVVAAAGNSNSNAPFYPAAYHNVISVAATGSTDLRASYSNYGYTVDVSAPGDAVYSTYYPGTYATLWGTSMASPHAAGTAALIKTANPGLFPVQVGEQLRVTSDNINGANPAYVDLLGKGRINAFRALSEDSPSLRGSDLEVTDGSGNNNGIPEPGEEIDLEITFTNFLSPTANATVTVTETSPYLTVTNASYTVGALGTMELVRNTDDPFQISIASNVPAGHVATLKLLMEDGTYSDYQWFTIIINPTFQSHDINDVHVTMTNNGRIGYNDFSTNLQGVGFHYPATSLSHIFEGGLIIGTSSTRLVNNIRVTDQSSQDNDFLSRTIYQLETPGGISNQDGSTWFSDSLAPVSNRIGIRVDQFTYAYSSVEDSDFVIVQYDLTNLTNTVINGLYVGEFFDWDIANFATNRTGFDASRDLAYAWDNATPDAPHIGVRAFEGAAGVRGIANAPGIPMDRAAKWGWISGGTAQSTVGPADIFFIISSGPYDLDPGETVRAGFGLIGGVDLPALQEHADAALARWEEILALVAVDDEVNPAPQRFSLEQNFPNPFNPTTSIVYHLADESFVTVRVYDVLGQEVATLVEGPGTRGTHNVSFDASGIPSGVYFYRLQAGAYSETRKLMLIR